MTSVEQFRQSIIGAWELTSYRCEPVEADDVTIYPMTQDAEGIIMYTPDGYMSAQLMIPGVPKFADGDLSGGTIEELSAAGKSYLAYSGPYTVSEDASGRPVLKHTMEVSSFPNWLNNTQVRTTDMKGNKLTLSTDSPIITMVSNI